MIVNYIAVRPIAKTLFTSTTIEVTLAKLSLVTMLLVFVVDFMLP